MRAPSLYEYRQQQMGCVPYEIVECDIDFTVPVVEVHPQTAHETFEALMNLPVEEAKG